MKYRYLIFLFVLFLACGTASGAVADDYAISIQQADTEGWNYSTICPDTGEICRLYMGITPQYKTAHGDGVTLDVGIILRPRTKKTDALFQFKVAQEYLFVSPGETIFTLPVTNDLPAKATVTLLKRTPAAAHDPVNSMQHNPVVRPAPETVATLNIIIDRAATKDSP